MNRYKYTSCQKERSPHLPRLATRSIWYRFLSSVFFDRPMRTWHDNRLDDLDLLGNGRTQTLYPMILCISVQADKSCQSWNNANSLHCSTVLIKRSVFLWCADVKVGESKFLHQHPIIHRKDHNFPRTSSGLVSTASDT